MKRLLLILPLVAGCATNPVSAPSSEIAELRAEVKALRAEVDSQKNASAFRAFRSGKRVSAKKDLRNDLPKGVAR